MVSSSPSAIGAAAHTVFTERPASHAWRQFAWHAWLMRERVGKQPAFASSIGSAFVIQMPIAERAARKRAVQRHVRLRPGLPHLGDASERRLGKDGLARTQRPAGDQAEAPAFELPLFEGWWAVPGSSSPGRNRTRDVGKGPLAASRADGERDEIFDDTHLRERARTPACGVAWTAAE
eukprot:3444349-Prymnesium_polylepis.2